MSSENRNNNQQWSEKTFKEKLCFIYKNITVEPLIICYYFPSVILSLAEQNLVLEKACRVNLHYSEEICDALTSREVANYTSEEIRVQQIVMGMSVWTSFVYSFIPSILIMFVGSWSDRRGKRKICMMLPLFGDMLSALGLIFCTYFFYEISMEVTGFVQAFFPSITGGWAILLMGTYSYLCEITSVEMRTTRIGAVSIFKSVSTPFGMALSGILIKILGFYGVFSIAAVGFFLGMMYGYFRIKDVNSPSYLTIILKSIVTSEKSNFATIFKRKLCIVWFVIKDLFDVKHIKETLSVVFKERPNNRRKRLLVLMLVLMVINGPYTGEMTVMYLFMRYRFNWDEVQFSIFSTYSVITHLIGTSFSVGVFSHLLKIDDAMIGVISCMSKILAGFVYAFAQTEWQVYLAPIVDIVNGTSFIAMRSIASKLVPPEELGKLNSLYGACEALTPLLYGPMYAFVYAHSMDSMPGAFFLLGGALTLPAVIIFAWMYTQHRGDRLQTPNPRPRKPSMAEGVLKSIRVEQLAVTPTMLDPSETSTAGPVVEMNGGHVNTSFEEDKTS